MEARPFQVQSPQSVAEEYGGDKQKIAQAMQMGLVDPTAGVLAGMFIDRMRGAAMAEQAPKQTVAQQVFTPPVPQMPPQGMQVPQQAGLGALPPGNAPDMGAMAMPPMPEAAPAPEGPTVGMAGGGLSDLPIPDTMFDEPGNGGFNDGYGGGGLVAFAAGAEVAPAAPSTFYGYSASDPMANLARYESLFGRPESKYAGEYEQELLRERSPEARKRARGTDLGYALMAMGSKIASTPGSLLQALSGGLSAGAPILYQSARERKAEERDIRKGLLDIEAGRNTAAAQRAAGLMDMQKLGIEGQEAQATRQAQIDLENLRQKGDIALEQLRQSGRVAIAGMRGSGGGGGGGGDGGGGRGKSVTLNRQSELREKVNSAKKDMDEAHAAWLARGKRTGTAEHDKWVNAAQRFQFAAEAWRDAVPGATARQSASRGAPSSGAPAGSVLTPPPGFQLD